MHCTIKPQMILILIIVHANILQTHVTCYQHVVIVQHVALCVVEGGQKTLE